jgi:uncharacterized protein YggU (UPF0235/DUF167 family)
MKILLADDDQDQLELRTLLLEKKGFETMAFTTAGEALKAAKIRHPHCAVIDLKLPTEAAGLGLIRSLKALDAEMRVFILTGGDAKRINALPEMNLVEEVIVKGSSTAYLLRKLAELEDPQLLRLRTQLAKDKVVTFDVKAMPRAAHSEVVGMTTDGVMKVRVAAIPDKGKANEELRDVLAAWFKVPKNHVELLHGDASQRKLWRVRK